MSTIETDNGAAAQAEALKALADEAETFKALADEAKEQTNALNSKVDGMPDDERKAQFRAVQAATENQRREERQARIAARKAKKNEPKVTEMSKESNVTPLWPAAKAVATIKRARADGYFPITILPHNLKRENAGKQPARFYGGLWGGWKDWETQVQTATLDALTDWQGHSNSVPNAGILCGTKTEGGFFIGVDIDCEAQELVAAIAKLAGGIAIRKGNPERSGLIALVVDELGEHEVFKCGDDKIQLLREGKQFVAAGIHPKAKRPYCWEDGDELPVDMPALAELPRVAMADLVRVLGENGFMPSTASASKPASGRKAALLAELRGSELDADSFDELFIDEGAPFPLAVLRKNNPAFARRYDKYAGGEAEIESHHANRVAILKDMLRAWPDAFTIEHAAVFCEGWPGAGQRVDKREAKGEWDDARLCNAFSHAEAAIKAETSGEVKPHPSTKEYTGEGFGAVDDEDEENDESEDDAKDDVKDDAQSTDATPTDAPPTSAKKGVDAAPLPELPFEFEYDVASNSKLPDWMVEDLVETKTLAVFYGPPNHGKSLLLLDMLYHVAAGRPWRGRDVKQGCVLFIAVEGPNGTARRAKAWRHHHGIADDVKLPMAFMRVGIDLYKNSKDARRIIDAVKRLEAQTGLPCRAVAIDTISATTPGMDQNSEMGVFISRCRLILDGTDTASVIAVHHPGKNLAHGLRGDSNLIGAVEMTLLVNNGVAETEKMRDGVSGQTIPFKVTVEMLWKNDKHKPVGAPVAIETSAAPAMGAVQDSDDAVTKDTHEDKLIGALNALETCVEIKASAINEDREDVSVSAGTVLAQLNKDRKADGLPELKDRSIIPKLLAKLVAAGKITKAGENKHTEYSLADF